MTQASPDIFALAEQRLAWLGKRQEVLAQNIANANTPGYAARQVEPFTKFLASAAQRSAAASMSGSGPAPTTAMQVAVDRTAPERSPDGNAVSLDTQLEKVAETDTAHQLAMNIYRKYQSLFKAALDRN